MENDSISYNERDKQIFAPKMKGKISWLACEAMHTAMMRFSR